MMNLGMMSQMPTGRLEETMDLARNRFDARINGTPMERALEAAMPNNAATLAQQQAAAGVFQPGTSNLAVDPLLNTRKY